MYLTQYYKLHINCVDPNTGANTQVSKSGEMSGF